jgi:hypothetical protein|tara:strand:+ start:14597 stop:14788 length:192 start_codon:yes stop_codon:yes gene_type:complete
MYSDKYKIRLPFEVLSDLKEMKVVAKPKKPKKPKRKVLQPFTGKGKQKSKVEDILLQVDKISA